MHPPGSVIAEYKALAVDLKGKNFYDHCFVAVHALNMWPWWEPPAHAADDLPVGNCVERALCALLPARLLDMAVHLQRLPTFFEEYDLVCPWLAHYEHSAKPNCALRVAACTNCKHHIVSVVALAPVRKSDRLTLLHAPQDLLRAWHARATHYVPAALDIPADNGSEAAAFASGHLTPDLLRGVSLVIRHAHLACGSTCSLSMFHLFLYLMGSRGNIAVTTLFGRIRNAHLTRVQRLKLKAAAAVPHGVVAEPEFWSALAKLCVKHKPQAVFIKMLDTVVKNIF